MQSFWSRIFHYRVKGDTDPRPYGVHSRRHRIESEITELCRELNGLKSEILVGYDGSASETDFALNVRRHLVKSRDLRYKISLLKAEIERSFPSSKVAATGHCREKWDVTPEIHVKRTAERILERAFFERNADRTMFELAAKDLVGADRERRKSAVKTIRKLELPESVFLFQAAMAIDDDLLQADCLNSLVELNGSDVSSELERCVHSESYKLRLAALRGLYNCKSPDIVSASLQSLADIHPEVRKSAAAFLGLQNSRLAQPALSVMLRDEDAEVRIAAARALETICSEQSVFMLIRTLEDDEVPVRKAAMSALARTLSVQLDLDVNQEPDVLFPKVESLLLWWSIARAEGAPWTVPKFLQHETPRLVAE